SSTMWTPNVSNPTLRLEAGETRELLIHLEPYGQVSDGYESVLRVSAQSNDDPEVVVVSTTALTYYDKPGARQDRNRGHDLPRLELSLTTGIEARFGTPTEGDVPSIRYRFGSRLEGDLSDWVKLNAST